MEFNVTNLKRLLHLLGLLPSGSSSSHSSGMANPMTAVGDLIVGGTAGTAEALTAGDETEVLTVVDGAPAWAAAPDALPAVGDAGDVLTTVDGAWAAAAPSGGGGSATAPEVVAQLTVENLSTVTPKIELLNAATEGHYRITVTGQGGDEVDGTVFYTFYFYYSTVEISVSGDSYAVAPGGSVKAQSRNDCFYHDGTGPISFEVSTYSYGNFDLRVVLEKLPVVEGDKYVGLFIGIGGDDSEGCVVTTDPENHIFVATDEDEIELTPVPKESFHFVAWTGDVSEGHETDNPLALTMTGPKAVTATFEADA